MNHGGQGNSYPSRNYFIADRMEHSKCLRGRDLHPDQRHCAICSEAIGHTSAVAKICPQSDQHVFHWLCMLRWLTTWGNGEFCRSCPDCHTELFQVFPGRSCQPSEEVQRLRMEIADVWVELLRHRSHAAHFDGFNFIERRFHESGVDHLTPLKLAMHGHVNFAVVMGFLADPEGVEIQRSGAYMTDNESALRNLLQTARFLLSLIRPLC